MMILAAIVILAFVTAALAVTIKTDGYGRRPIPRSHVDQFAPPSRFH
ncbi:hypothetical protein BH09ACT10_BH09ACT10_02160 [soil metagenome]